jgi:hypothetical protein
MPNKPLELTTTVRPLKWMIRAVGIESMIGSTEERSSPQGAARSSQRLGAGSHLRADHGYLV